MTKDAALRLALATLNEIRSETFRLMRNGQTLYAEKKVWDTIIAIKQVMKQPEPEPVKVMGFDCVCGRRLMVESNSGVVASPPKREPLTEAFVVKHYASDERPVIKGNGFDGLEIGENREEAEAFVAWINDRIAAHGIGEKP